MLAVVVAALHSAEEGLRSEACKEEYEDVPRNLSKKTSPMTIEPDSIRCPQWSYETPKLTKLSSKSNCSQILTDMAPHLGGQKPFR